MLRTSVLICTYRNRVGRSGPPFKEFSARTARRCGGGSGGKLPLQFRPLPLHYEGSIHTTGNSARRQGAVNGAGYC